MKRSESLYVANIAVLLEIDNGVSSMCSDPGHAAVVTSDAGYVMDFGS
jgi:hypothetical protein